MSKLQWLNWLLTVASSVGVLVIFRGAHGEMTGTGPTWVTVLGLAIITLAGVIYERINREENDHGA